VAAAERLRVGGKLNSHIAACQLDLEQLLTLAACMVEETLYERSDSRLDYMKRGVEVQHAIARSAAIKRLKAATAAAPSPASAAEGGEAADVTGLLALAQSSVEQKQSELSEWGQKRTEESEDVAHGLDDDMIKSRTNEVS